MFLSGAEGMERLTIDDFRLTIVYQLRGHGAEVRNQKSEVSRRKAKRAEVRRQKSGDSMQEKVKLLKAKRNGGIRN